MNIVLGFGATEAEFEEGECTFVDEFLKEHLDQDNYFIVTDEIAKQLANALRERAEGYHAKAEEYKEAAEFPDRYSHYWFTVLHDASHVCVIFTFHHINRRHALSPDGWGLLSGKIVHHFDTNELR